MPYLVQIFIISSSFSCSPAKEYITKEVEDTFCRSVTYEYKAQKRIANDGLNQAYWRQVFRCQFSV